MNSTAARKTPSGNSLVELRPRLDTTMDHVELLAWAKDIRCRTRILDVRTKCGRSELRSDATEAFSSAFSELTRHHLTALQVRYVSNGQMYFDTCLSERGAFRLVRLRFHAP